MPNHESLFKHLRFAICLVIVLVSLQKPCYLNGLREADYASGLWLLSPSGPDPQRRRLVSAVLCPTWVFLLILRDAQRTSPFHRWPEVSPSPSAREQGKEKQLLLSIGVTGPGAVCALTEYSGSWAVLSRGYRSPPGNWVVSWAVSLILMDLPFDPRRQQGVQMARKIISV